MFSQNSIYKQNLIINLLYFESNTATNFSGGAILVSGDNIDINISKTLFNKNKALLASGGALII